MPHYTKQRRYGPDELVADAFVHGVGLSAMLAGGFYLLPHVIGQGMGNLAAFLIYWLALVSMLAFSAAYNLTPPSPLKWVLRRFDHSAIYLLIAGTYMPLLYQIGDGWLAPILAIVLWTGTALGVALKVLLPGRYDGFAVVTYLALGWVGLVAMPSFANVLPGITLFLIAAGGVLYSVGVPFYLWERLKYQNAIWHGFVVAAAACHFLAIALIYL
jgi:hemolysin III